MNRTSTWLLEYKRNVYSQTGEDGIIQKILEVIPQNDKWCVEFGAWNGSFLSNTRNLIESRDYSAVLIEADEVKMKDLQSFYLKNEKVMTLNRIVGFNKNDNLDQILSSTPIPSTFDFLSIDIDGNDYHVWNAIINYKPKVICIEFNPTIPTHIQFVQPPDQSVSQGASLLSLVELGRVKGYELVSVLDFNAFFVRRDYYPLFQLDSNSPEMLRTNLGYITYLFSGVDGQIFLHGYCRLPWHGIDLKESRIQHLPRCLRKHPSNYSRIQRIALRLYLKIIEPIQIIHAIRTWISRASRHSGTDKRLR